MMERSTNYFVMLCFPVLCFCIYVTTHHRDYRFYDEDMLHPSSVAVDYIWSRLQQTYFDSSPATTRYISDLSGLNQSLSHRPLHPQTEAHQKFVSKQLAKIDKLCREYPHLNLDDERALFQAQVTTTAKL